MADFSRHSGRAPPDFSILNETSTHARAQRDYEHALISFARAGEVLPQRSCVRIVHHLQRNRGEGVFQHPEKGNSTKSGQVGRVDNCAGAQIQNARNGDPDAFEMCTRREGFYRILEQIEVIFRPLAPLRIYGEAFL